MPNEEVEVLVITITPDEKVRWKIAVNPDSEPGKWGIVLADMVRHLGESYRLLGKPDALERILEIFGKEIAEPTDSPTGQLQRTH